MEDIRIKNRRSLQKAGFSIDEIELEKMAIENIERIFNESKIENPLTTRQEKKVKLMKWDEIGISLAVVMIAVATFAPYF